MSMLQWGRAGSRVTGLRHLQHAALGAMFVLALALPSAAQGPEFHYRQGGELVDVFFLDSSRGWTAEDGGRTRFTTTGGDTWDFGKTPDEVRGHLRGVFFRDPDLGWAVGDEGVVVRSTNGGMDWAWVNEANPVLDVLDNPAELWDIHMIDDDIGWVVGIDGAVARTADGGETWTSMSPFDPQGPGGSPVDIYDIHFFNGLDGIMVGDYFSILRTENGGVTWVQDPYSQSCPSVFGNLELWGITFENPTDPDTDIWVSGGVGTNQGYIYHWDGLAWTLMLQSTRVPRSAFGE